MKWYNQIRWRLFFLQLGVIIVAVVIFLAIAQLMAGAALLEGAPFDDAPTAGVVTEEDTGQSPLPLQARDKESLLERYQTVIHEALLAGAFAAISATILVNLFVTRRIVEPLQDISIVSRRLSQGFYRERLVVTHDDELSELYRSVNQLAEALEQTENRRLSLLADVTHELRTPLSTIEGYMEGIIDGVVEPDTQTFSLLMHEAKRLQRLIEDLELLSRAEAGQIPIVACTVELATVLETMVSRFYPQFQAKKVRLELFINEMLPPVWADADRVEQILINLLNNALRYTPSGGRVTLRAWSGEHYVVVSIKDTGIGIEPSHIPHLFERFYRVDKSRARTSGGSGIGLTIARHLVYAQGGDIWARSEGPGRGADFRFTLPLASDYGLKAQRRAAATASQSDTKEAPSTAPQ